MKLSVLTLQPACLALFVLEIAAFGVEWSQPPVACVEEVVPMKAGRECLDLSMVKEPLKDWPQDISEEEKRFWQSERRGLTYCRGAEVLRREALNPGTSSPVAVEISWMRVRAVENAEAKVDAIYQATRQNKVPAQVLTGALMQESLLAELGIAEDGGNYSCGIGQINVNEWCRWAQNIAPEERRAIGLPSEGLSCARVDASLVKPFYDIALTRLHGEPEYKLEKHHFREIDYSDVIASFPDADEAVQRLRFEVVTSFVNHCSGAQAGIAAKAHEIALLYKQFVPDGLKKQDVYQPGGSYQRQCREHDQSGLYPLHSGYLLAVGMYNAGPRALDALAHYQKWKREDLSSPSTFANFTPRDLVESFYWSGRYDSKTDKIFYSTLSGGLASWVWYRPCVLQRHIARVAQHVTLSGVEPLLESLEAGVPCAMSTVDPVTGERRTAVPPKRQTSSGVK